MPTALDLEGRQTSSKRGALAAWLRDSIDNEQHWLEYELLALALATGIIDAVSFPKFHCFVSNQTGNTVLFAVTAFALFGTRQETTFQVPAPHLVTSLGFFVIGVFTAGQISNWLDAKSSRWWLLTTNIFQTIFVLLASLLSLLFPTGHYDGTATNTAPILCSIALLALSSGSQVAMSRQLGMPEIPTTQATAAYVDLLVDTRFFVPITENRGRNRRAAFIITLCIGSFVGAPAYHYVSTALAIFLAAIIKIFVTIMFLFNKTKAQRGNLSKT
ncbi:hypothetical protein HII31_11019 [Pseudocercospora fuligena]|uniref:DUF1275 domain protein n=1 Tax=Pseudocercospora fuligena TaxID=685502 RepID=A0A8H6R9A5_9PEZI|nr:hypothetical protein HII31_11019 [Pseudocercospora fuligena]